MDQRENPARQVTPADHGIPPADHGAGRADRTDPAGPVDPGPEADVVLRPLRMGAARIAAGLWAERQRVNREVTIPEGAKRLKESGTWENLEIAAGTSTAAYRGPLFADSDLYKWLEAVGWEEGREPSDDLAGWRRDGAAALARAQEPDGYLNSYVRAHGRERFADLPWGHELYCAGHLMQAAVAQYRATGDDALLAVARRFADYLAATFGEDARHGVGGHPEIETALVELARATGTPAYGRLAAYFVDGRGRGLLETEHPRSYFSDRIPVREATTVEGHAVRALYLAAGAADVAAEDGDRELLRALETQWRHMVETKTYLTGGVGSRWEGEAFGEPYELPPDRAYCETCAAIASVQWSWRMLLATGEVRYADLIERTLFNAFLPGISLDGREFFYANALQVRAGAVGSESTGGRHPANGRQAWYSCACCPPNIMRLLSSLDHYLATGGGSGAGAGIQLHQYAAGTVETGVAGGAVAFDVATDYPWDGRVAIRMRETPDPEWTLSLRVPGWATGATATVNGTPVEEGIEPGSYLRLRRAWRADDHVVLTMPMEPRLTEPDPRVDAVRGCVAVERGPLVYCFELGDQPEGVAVEDLTLEPGSLRDERRPELLGGVTVVRASGRVHEPVAGGELPYRPRGAVPAPGRTAELVAIPYLAWANRGPGPMRVWIPATDTSR